jgi:hypothetical protein
MRKIAALLVFVFALGVQAASAESGTNWNATYYNTNDLSGPVVHTEVLPSGINVNWGIGSPAPAVNADNFSARFTSVQSFSGGVYEFRISSDDGVRLYIDGVRVLDKFVGRVLTTDTFQQTLTAGTHSVTVEYVEFIDQAAIRLEWFILGTEPALTEPQGIADGRVNNLDLAAPVAVYCQSDALHIYAITPEGEGVLALIVTDEEIAAAAENTEATLITTGEGTGGEFELWRTAEGKLLLRAHELPPETGKLYDLVWDGCP